MDGIHDLGGRQGFGPVDRHGEDEVHQSHEGLVHQPAHVACGETHDSPYKSAGHQYGGRNLQRDAGAEDYAAEYAPPYVVRSQEKLRPPFGGPRRWNVPVGELSLQWVVRGNKGREDCSQNQYQNDTGWNGRPTPEGTPSLNE